MKTKITASDLGAVRFSSSLTPARMPSACFSCQSVYYGKSDGGCTAATIDSAARNPV
jgi:hypothetical protein